MSQAETVKEAKQTGGVVLYDGFVFGKNELSKEKMELSGDTVRILQYPFEPNSTPAGFDAEEYRQALASALVFLVGTTHGSHISCAHVRNTMLATQPDIVMVELCPGRYRQLMDLRKHRKLRARTSTWQGKKSIIKEMGVARGLALVLSMFLAALKNHLDVYNYESSEFYVAYKESQKMAGCQFVLGDRPHEVTLLRALIPMSNSERSTFFRNMAIRRHMIEIPCPEDVFRKECIVYTTFVDERDTYMTHQLHQLLLEGTYKKLNASKIYKKKFEPLRVVAVVGSGHLPGMQAKWTTQLKDTSALLSIPEFPLFGKIRWIRPAIGLGLCSLVGYGLYRAGRSRMES